MVGLAVPRPWGRKPARQHFHLYRGKVLLTLFSTLGDAVRGYVREWICLLLIDHMLYVPSHVPMTVLFVLLAEWKFEHRFACLRAKIHR